MHFWSCSGILSFCQYFLIGENPNLSQKCLITLTADPIKKNLLYADSVIHCDWYQNVNSRNRLLKNQQSINLSLTFVLHYSTLVCLVQGSIRGLRGELLFDRIRNIVWTIPKSALSNQRRFVSMRFTILDGLRVKNNTRHTPSGPGVSQIRTKCTPSKNRSFLIKKCTIRNTFWFWATRGPSETAPW